MNQFIDAWLERLLRPRRLRDAKAKRAEEQRLRAMRKKLGLVRVEGLWVYPKEWADALGTGWAITSPSPPPQHPSQQ